jgi:hypothetical protein
VSPWWREQVRAGLAPDAVVLRRWSRGPSRRERDTRKFEVTAAQGVAPWQSALHAFAASAATLGWRNVDLHVVLSSHLVRYLVLPQINNLNDDDALVYAGHELQAVYGDCAQSWIACLNRAAPGGPHVAAATERGLVEQLESQAALLGMRLCSVRPVMSAAIDALPPHERNLNALLVVIESGRLCVARFEQGNCVQVRTAGYMLDPAAALLTLLEQDALSAGVDVRKWKIHVQSAAPFDGGVLREHGWQVLPAEGRFP